MARPPGEGTLKRVHAKRQTDVNKEQRSGGTKPATPRPLVKPIRYYHQGPPATKAAAVPSAAQRSASLRFMEPSFQIVDSSWAQD